MGICSLKEILELETPTLVTLQSFQLSFLLMFLDDTFLDCLLKTHEFLKNAGQVICVLTDMTWI